MLTLFAETFILSSGATSSIFHSHAAKKCCNFSAANFIRGPIYVKFFIHVQLNAAVTFEIMLESSIIKDRLTEKTSSLYCSAFTHDEEEVARKKEQVEASG